MEAHPTEFHNSNLANIESKIKSKSCDVDMDSIKGAFAAADNGKGAVPFVTMKGLLAQFDLNDHEILTIARKYAQQDATKNDIEKTKSLVQEKLRKEVKTIIISSFGFIPSSLEARDGVMGYPNTAKDSRRPHKQSGITSFY